MLTALPSSVYPLTLSQSRPLRYSVFFYLYVMQGIPAGFYLTALTNYFTAEGVKPNVVGSFIAIIGLPWAFQFIWGPLIDRYQSSPMGRRKPWVVASQLMTLLTSTVLLFVKDPVAQVSTLGWLFGLRSIFAAIQDASVDAMAITIIPEDERGRANAFMRAGFLIGMGIGAAVFAPILRQYGFHSAALLLIACLSTGAVLMLFIREQPYDRLFSFFGQAAPTYTSGDSKNKLSEAARSSNAMAEKTYPEHDFRWLFTELFKGIFSRQSILLFGAILLAYTANALFLRAYNHHLIEQLKWRDTDLSVLTGTYGTVAATIIGLTGGYLADHLGARKMLVIMVGLVATYLIGFNLLANLWVHRDIARTGLVAIYFMDPAVSAAAMPVLMNICRKGVEGSQFTTYMAFVNLCDVGGTFFAGQALLYFAAPTIGLFAGSLSAFAVVIIGLTVRYYRRTHS